jgi:hypothetical protein
MDRNQGHRLAECDRKESCFVNLTFENECSSSFETSGTARHKDAASHPRTRSRENVVTWENHGSGKTVARVIQNGYGESPTIDTFKYFHRGDEPGAHHGQFK